MNTKVLAIGDVRVYDSPVIMKCYGLKTCIGLFVKDRLTGISGGAHIFLPDTGKFNTMGVPSASESIGILLDSMQRSGASLSTLRAKIAGGAITCTEGYDIGTQNTTAVIETLKRNKVFIAAMDVGGTISRTVEFSTTSGDMEVKNLEKNESKIF